MVKPAIVYRLEDSAPIDEVNHSSKPAGSRAALTGAQCDRCGINGHTSHHGIEMIDMHLNELGADFDIGDVPRLCRGCAERLGYTDLNDLREEDLEEDVVLHGQQLRELNNSR